jgi:hypothetical protein
MSLVGDLLKEILNVKVDQACAWLDGFLTEEQQQTLLEGLFEGRMTEEEVKTLPSDGKKPFIPDKTRPSESGDCEKESDSYFRGDNHG